MKMFCIFCYIITNMYGTSLRKLYFIPDHKKLMIQVAEFLVKHFTDSRIVNLGSKDSMIEALAGFVAKKPTLEIVENISLQR